MFPVENATLYFKPDEFEVFDYVPLCPIVEAFDYRTFDCVRLAKLLGEFDNVRLPNPIELNRAIGFDRVRLLFSLVR